jgi:hypothetical protein
LKLSNVYDSEPYRTISIGSKKFYWPFPIAKGLHGSDAIVFGIRVWGSDSKILQEISNFFRKLKDLEYWFMYRLHPSHKYHIIKTGLKPSYYDIDHIMLYGNMVLLCRYVEDECYGEVKLAEEVEWRKKEHEGNAFTNSTQEALDIYRWWKYEYQKNWDIYDKHLSETFSGEMKSEKGEDGLSRIVDFGVNKDAEWTPEQLHNYEASLLETEEQMLIRLIKIRRCLWT